MKRIYYALVLFAFAGAHANILDEELDMRLTDSQEQQISDEDIAAFEQELAHLAQEAEAQETAEENAKELVEALEPKEEEIVVLEEEQPKELVILEEEQPSKEALREAELQALLANIEEQENE